VRHRAVWHRQAVRSRRPVVRRVTAGGIAAAAALAIPALATGPATAASHVPGGARGAATAAVSGTLRAWGLGGNGQLGNGGTRTSTVPVKVKLPAGTTITSVRAGCFHTLALTSTGQVLAWGSNASGELGDGTTQFRATPVKVHIPAGTTIKAIRAGCFHSLALTSTGQVLAWGLNTNGELGNGTTTDSHTPVPVSLPTGTTVKAISAGEAHSLALTSTGQVLAWGFNAVGQLGNASTTDSDIPVPVALPTGIKVAGIAAGGLHSLALTSTGQVLAWGFGLQGELGNGTTNNNSDTPVMVTLPPGTTVRQLSAGCEHSLALTSTGQVLAWGFNADGELGNDSTQDSDVPVMAALPQGTTATEVSAGCNHSLALTGDGRVLAWGRNDDGELGNASTTSSDVPVQVNLPASVTPVATGAGPEARVSFAIVQKTAS
jgi:alpha-tubulin suppressor-like RCC1 family protein